MTCRATRVVAATVILLLMYACSGNIVSNNYQVIEGSRWARGTEYHFSFMIEDVSAAYDVIVELRHYDSYPFHNIWLFCTEESPVGLLVRDTVEGTLADEHGLWTGRGLSLREASFPIRTRHRFPIRGQYNLSVRHGMRGDALPGVREIGLRIEKL